MKPRITLAETLLPDGSTLELQEHDSRKYLLIKGQQICGPATMAAEAELALLACAPFRPARQPKIWLVGAGLGHSVEAVAKQLTQKKGQFIVAEPLDEVIQWHRDFLPESPLNTDSRVIIEHDCGPSGLTAHAGVLHAIITHLDASPTGPRNRPWADDRRWLAAAYEALQPGGLLAIGGSRYQATVSRNLKAAGFDVAEYTVPSSPNAKKPRMLPIWLGRKGRPTD